MAKTGGEYVLVQNASELKDGTRLLIIGTRTKTDTENNTETKTKYALSANNSMMGGGKGGTKVDDDKFSTSEEDGVAGRECITYENVPEGVQEIILEQVDGGWYLNVDKDENSNKLYLYATEKKQKESDPEEDDENTSGFNFDEMMEMFMPSTGLKVGTTADAEAEDDDFGLNDYPVNLSGFTRARSLLDNLVLTIGRLVLTIGRLVLTIGRLVLTIVFCRPSGAILWVERFYRGDAPAYILSPLRGLYVHNNRPKLIFNCYFPFFSRFDNQSNCVLFGFILFFQLHWAVIQRVGLGVVDLHHHGGDALAEDAYLTGGTPREVDDAATSKGSAVVYFHYHHAVVGGVGHLEQRAKLMRAVGAGQTVVVQALAAAGQPPRGSLAIVGGDALLRLAYGQTKG